MAPVKHGHARWKNNTTPEYRSWAAMLARCNNPNNKRYPRYGGRGIIVCGRWKDFFIFLADMGPRPSALHSLDRINNDGNYEPTNCRWATAKEQGHSNYKARRIAGFGTEMLLTEWAAKYGVGHKVIARRMAKGMTLEQAVTTPVNNDAWKTRRKNGGTNRMITALGKTMTLSAWSLETGIPRSVITYRIGKNWDVERALTMPVMMTGEWQRAAQKRSK